jgi:hypothetical protein
MNIPTNRDAVLAKIYKVIQSCESLNQLDVAIEMVHCYRRMYEDQSRTYDLLKIASNVRTRLYIY